MEPVDLDAATLTWLLDPADPASRAKVLTDLLDRSRDDGDVGRTGDGGAPGATAQSRLAGVWEAR